MSTFRLWSDFKTTVAAERQKLKLMGFLQVILCVKNFVLGNSCINLRNTNYPLQQNRNKNI